MAENSGIYRFTGHAPFNIEVSSANLNGPYPVHSHEYTEVCIFISGTGTHVVCGQEYPVGPGDLFAINPDASHGFVRAKNLFHYKVNYMRDALKSLDGSLRQMPGYQALFVLLASSGNKGFPCRMKLSPEDMKWLVELVKKLSGELEGKEPGCETMVKACFMEFATGLARRYNRKLDSQSDLGHIDKLAILASHLERHCAEPASSKEMARIACLSERQLRRVFANYYQMSPGAYLLRCRVQRAASLLASTAQTVSEVAFASGFHESSYFCRQFRRIMKTSPMAYRKKRGFCQRPRETQPQTATDL